MSSTVQSSVYPSIDRILLWDHSITGPLELLRSIPSSSSSSSSFSSSPPLLFLHGGFHSASCFRYFLPHIADRTQSICYSLSLRGHGASFRPSRLRLLFTPPSTLIQDVQIATKFIEKENNVKNGIILCGHSAGGGLAQYLLSNIPKNSPSPYCGLILLASIPATGAAPIFFNWFTRVDPLLFFRTLLFLGHPFAPLYTGERMGNAFFSKKFCTDKNKINEIWSELERWESYAWPGRFAFRFADEGIVKKNVGGNVAVIGGAEDKIIYNDAVKGSAFAYGVKEIFIHDSGHDLQLDNEWKDAADQIIDIVKQWQR